MSRIGSEEVADKQISSAARFNLSRRSQTQDMSSPVALQKAKKGVATQEISRSDSRNSNRLSQASEQSWANTRLEQEAKTIYLREYNSSPVELEVTILTRAKLNQGDSENPESQSLRGKL